MVNMKVLTWNLIALIFCAAIGYFVTGNLSGHNSGIKSTLYAIYMIVINVLFFLGNIIGGLGAQNKEHSGSYFLSAFVIPLIGFGLCFMLAEY